MAAGKWKTDLRFVIYGSISDRYKFFFGEIPSSFGAGPKGIDFTKFLVLLPKVALWEHFWAFLQSIIWYQHNFASPQPLYGTLDEQVYMKPPERYTEEKHVLKLKKRLYGLKQAPLCWNRCITDYIVKTGFKQSQYDPCLFVRTRGKEKIILALYVDDGLIASSSEKEAKYFLEEMRARFKITVKPTSYFLGMEIKRNSDGSILLHQKAYIARVLKRFGEEDSKTMQTCPNRWRSNCNLPISRSSWCRIIFHDRYKVRHNLCC